MTAVAESSQPAPGVSPPAPGPRRRPSVVTRAEAAECTCPDACERDHELD